MAEEIAVLQYSRQIKNCLLFSCMALYNTLCTHKCKMKCKNMSPLWKETKDHSKRTSQDKELYVHYGLNTKKLKSMMK